MQAAGLCYLKLFVEVGILSYVCFIYFMTYMIKATIILCTEAKKMRSYVNNALEMMTTPG